MTSPLDEPEVLARFRNIRAWKSGSKRAPNKPLLVLLALGRLQRGEDRLMAFGDAEAAIDRLMGDFGIRSKAEYPFWHLTSDGLWEVPGSDALTTIKGTRQPTRTALRTVSGGFPPDVYAALAANPQLLRDVADAILEEHFPWSYRAELLAAVGLDLEAPLVVIPPKRRRDPRFPRAVLQAYGHRCAVCGLAPLLDGATVGIEAAHVRWHCHGGPDEVCNGLGLCTLHHQAFDRGFISLASDDTVRVSARLHGEPPLEAFIGRFHGAPLKGPVHGAPSVLPRFRAWHAANVFKAPARPG